MFTFTKTVYQIRKEVCPGVGFDCTREEVENSIHTGGEFSDLIETFESKAKAIKEFNKSYKYAGLWKEKTEYSVTSYFVLRVTLEIELGDNLTDTAIMELDREEIATCKCPRNIK